jgi:hypothetical protein
MIMPRTSPLTAAHKVPIDSGRCSMNSDRARLSPGWPRSCRCPALLVSLSLAGFKSIFLAPVLSRMPRLEGEAIGCL